MLSRASRPNSWSSGRSRGGSFGRSVSNRERSPNKWWRRCTVRRIGRQSKFAPTGTTERCAMIRYATGDILKADVEALVNTVNCVGIMGRGIALQFKNAFPENFKAYAAACSRDDVQPGRMFVFETGTMTNPKYIINFPTKRHWRGKSRMEDIESGLRALVAEIRRRGIQSIAIPPLGSGLGGLRWPDVRARIEAALTDLEGVDVVVYEPSGAPVTACDPHSKHRIRVHPCLRGGPMPNRALVGQGRWRE